MTNSLNSKRNTLFFYCTIILSLVERFTHRTISLFGLSLLGQEINPCQSSATSQKCHAEWLEAELSNQSSPSDFGTRKHPKNHCERSDSACPPESGTTHKPKVNAAYIIYATGGFIVWERTCANCYFCFSDSSCLINKGKSNSV